MILRIRVAAPMSEAHAVKELLAMQLEGIGMAVVEDIAEDGFGSQIRMPEQSTEQESQFPETMAYINQLKRQRRR